MDSSLHKLLDKKDATFYFYLVTIAARNEMGMWE